MSALDLTVDSVDNAAAYGPSDTPRTGMPAYVYGFGVFRTKFGGINRRVRSVFSSLPRNIPAGGTDYSEAKVTAILRDFLQPDTKLPLQEAAKSILVLIPANAAGNAEVCSFGEICVELAEQVPYDHPSQLKFAQLLHYLSMSPKFRDRYPLAPQEDCYQAFQLLWESLSDCFNGPVDESSTSLWRWVNLNAFMANLFSTGIWGTSPGQALEILREAFEETLEQGWEDNCNIMAAGQWILRHGQTLFKLIIFDGLEGDAKGKGDWRFGTAFAGPPMKPRSIDRWRFWKAGFQAVENMSHASRDCKDVAKKAACMMASLEEAMVSMTPNSCEDVSPSLAAASATS